MPSWPGVQRFAATGEEEAAAKQDQGRNAGLRHGRDLDVQRSSVIGVAPGIALAILTIGKPNKKARRPGRNIKRLSHCAVGVTVADEEHLVKLGRKGQKVMSQAHWRKIQRR